MNNFTIVSMQTDKLSREEIKMNETTFKRYLNSRGIRFRSCLGQSVQWGREKSIIVYKHLNRLEKDFIFHVCKQEAIISNTELLFSDGSSRPVEKVYSTLLLGSFYDTVRYNGYGDCTIVPWSKNYTEVIELKVKETE